MTRRERPGTAVLWEEQYFEVVLEQRSGEAVRYVLEPWRDEHIMRVTDAYDEVSEARRDADYRAALLREKQRKSANLLGMFTGLLPAPVQEHLASELGLLPTKLTILSFIPTLAFEIIAVHFIVRDLMAHNPIPTGWAAAAGYVAIEAWIRTHLALAQSRPAGTLAGFVVYLVFYAATFGKMGPPPITLRSSQPDADRRLKQKFDRRV